MKFQDVIRFFNAKKINDKCHVCGEETWILYVNNGRERRLHGMPFVDPNADYDEFQGMHASGISVLNVECDNCGCLRVFSAKKIATWIAENPDGEQSTPSPAGGSAT